jgi:hypothetical protein
MKWKLIIPIIAVVTALSFCQSNSATIQKKSATHNSKAFAVLELFTSEGCSSCPSADKLLPVLAEEDSNIITLSFHVDYWDNLGWKDAFSDALFTERQRQYAEQFHLESIYTPQLVINGQYELVGSNKQKAESFIKKVQQESSTAEIKINDVKKQDQTLSISCHLEGDIKNAELLTALVQKHAERKIGGGENRGATLQHTNVVRSFIKNDAKSNMNFSMKIPTDLKDTEWQLVIYLQRKSDLKIISAKIINTP